MQQPSQIRDDIAALRQQSETHLRPLEAVLDSSTASKTRNTRGIHMTANKRNNRWLRLGVALAVLIMTGAVFAATQTSLFSIWVDTDGKSEAQVEDEIHDQLVEEGVEPSRVEFKRHGDGSSRLDIEGSKGDREFKLVRREIHKGDHDGDAPSTVIQMEPPQIDAEREPGMTDEQLEAKILAQLEQLGLTGKVKVKGDEVEVRIMQREVVCEGDDPECEEHRREMHDLDDTDDVEDADHE